MSCIYLFNFQDTSSKMSKSNSSPIWTYFLLSDTDHAKCKICNKLISRKGRTTSAMRNHIKSIHKEEFSNLEKIENQKREELTILSNLSPHQASRKNELKQSSIVECIERTKNGITRTRSLFKLINWSAK